MSHSTATRSSILGAQRRNQSRAQEAADGGSAKTVLRQNEKLRGHSIRQANLQGMGRESAWDRTVP